MMIHIEMHIPYAKGRRHVMLASYKCAHGILCNSTSLRMKFIIAVIPRFRKLSCKMRSILHILFHSGNETNHNIVSIVLSKRKTEESVYTHLESCDLANGKIDRIEATACRCLSPLEYFMGFPSENRAIPFRPPFIGDTIISVSTTCC